MTNTDGASTPGWEWMYRIGGIAALLMFIVIPIQVVVFIAYPPPATVQGYFALFQQNRLLGLLDLDLLLIVDNILIIPLNVALYQVLWQKNRSFTALAAAFGFLAIFLYLVSREATFSMMMLSDQYAAAATDAGRQALLAAGQTLLTTYNGTVFNLNYVLGAVSLIIASLVMLRYSLFSKAIAYLGIAANVIGLGLYVPGVGIYISVFSVIFLWVWDLLIGLKFLQMAKPAAASQPIAVS
jgi:hypothetical protein